MIFDKNGKMILNPDRREGAQQQGGGDENDKPNGDKNRDIKKEGKMEVEGKKE